MFPSRVGAAALLTFALATSSAAAPDPRSEPDRQAYAGRFSFVGGERERKAKDAAIERVTGDMFFVVRGVARSRLRERTTIAPWVRFEFPPGRIKATVPGHAPAVSPDDGAPARYEVGDETVELRQYVAEGHLVQRFSAEDGARINDYTLNADTLTLRVTVTSPKLSKPLRYTLTYRR